MNSFLYIVVFCQLICISYWYHEICWKATNIRLFSIFRTFCETVYKFQTSCFDELIFSHELECCVESSVTKVDFKFCVYKLVKAVRFLKFKWEFIIICRGCLVLLKFKFKLCKDHVPLALNFLVLIRHPFVLNNYPSNIRTRNIWGLFGERNLTVLLSV